MTSTAALSKVEIREEQSADYEDIHTLTELAFRGRPYAGGDEQDVIVRLRSAGDLTLSLIAVIDSKVVGQITFSPATVADHSQPWFALGPVSVLPEFQGKGIGSQLINAGLSRIVDLGALGCILTGNPAYYQRFGFDFSPQNCPQNEPAEFFMLKLLAIDRPIGIFQFHSAFYATD
jgi:putative acetyltransferase